MTEIKKGHSAIMREREDTIRNCESSTEFADGDFIKGKEFKRETGYGDVYSDEIEAAKRSRLAKHHAQNMPESARNSAGNEDGLSENMLNLSESESSGSQSGNNILVNERKLLLHKGKFMPVNEQNSSAIEPWKRHVEVLNFEESEGLIVESDGVVMEMVNPLPLESYDDDDDDVEIKGEFIESDGEAEGERYIESDGEIMVDNNRGSGVAVHQHKSNKGKKTGKKSIHQHKSSKGKKKGKKSLANPSTINDKSAVQYKCSICKKKFQRQLIFLSHFLSHSVLDRYSCPLCNQWFRNKRSLRVHLRSHMATTSNPHSSSSLKTLFKDVDIKSSVSYRCRQCQTEFNTRKACLRHSAGHLHAQTEMPCHICQKLYYNYFTLAQHLKKHSGKWYRCSVCKKYYIHKNSLDQHLRLKHHGKGHTRGFQCTICGNCYNLESTLKKHLRIHSQTRMESQLHGGSENSELTSKVCGVEYQNIQEVSAHRVVDKEDISPQKVSEAQEKCPREPITSFVANDINYPCNLCDKVFSSLKMVHGHMNVHRDQKKKKKPIKSRWIRCQLICKRCNRPFNKKYTYSKHISLHESSNECHMCPQQFSCKKDYMDHYESHMQKEKPACEDDLIPNVPGHLPSSEKIIGCESPL